MLFRDVLFLSVLVASVSATPAIHPLLISRQNLGQCQNQCSLVTRQEPNISSGACDLSCICTSTFISTVSSCINCLEQTGQTLDGVPSNLAQQLTDECDQAGYPVSGSSGDTTGSLDSATSGLGGTTATGGLGGTTVTGGLGGTTATGGLGSTTVTGGLGGTTVTGGLGGTTITAISSTSTKSSSSGNSGGPGLKAGAIALSTNLGSVLAVAIATGLVVLSA